MIKSFRVARFRPTHALQRGHYLTSHWAILYTPRAVRKWIEHSLHRVLVPLKPSFWPISFSIVAPHLSVSVNRITGHTQDRPFLEEMTLDRHSFFGNNPG